MSNSRFTPRYMSYKYNTGVLLKKRFEINFSAVVGRSKYSYQTDCGSNCFYFYPSYKTAHMPRLEGRPGDISVISSQRLDLKNSEIPLHLQSKQKNLPREERERERDRGEDEEISPTANPKNTL